MAARGCSGREIAEAIGRSQAATRTLLTRSRQQVRARLEAQGFSRAAYDADPVDAGADDAGADDAAGTNR
jgi:hypothetical protein